MMLDQLVAHAGERVSETEATNRGQLVSSAIERAVRNALAVEVSGGDTLRVHTSLGGPGLPRVSVSAVALAQHDA